MANKLFYFLVRLGEDLELQRRFNDEPDKVMTEFELSAPEQALIRGQDERAIQQATVGNSDDFVVKKNWSIRKNWGKPPKKKK